MSGLSERAAGTATTIAERDAAARRLAAARFVAEHWRAHAVTWPQPTSVAAHPLCMVLAALDGETDPTALGLDEEAHEQFREALA